MVFVYKANPQRSGDWASLFAERAPDIDFRMWPDIGAPREVTYLGVWEPPEDIASRFPNLEVVFSLGAGVDQIDLSAIPSHVPLVRTIEPGIVDTMGEYAVFAVLALHRHLLVYIKQQRSEVWQQRRVRPAAMRTVGILGLGELGAAVARRLTSLGFPCLGWSRSRHEIADVVSFAGFDELPAFLARSHILVCLLPLTAETRGILSADLFRHLPYGAGLVNVGRGGHLVARHLLDALDAGQLGGAVLDVTDPEPLPPGHPFWAHPRILLTPHVASMTQPETAVDVILENIRRHRRGERMMGVVDRQSGY